MDAEHPHRRRRRLLIGTTTSIVLLVIVWLAFDSIAQPGSPAFYDPPQASADGPPGTILRKERLSRSADRQAWRVLYASTDPSGVPIAVSGVVVAPRGESPADGWPVVAWAHGTSGIAPSCAPSLYPGGGLSRIPELDELIAAGTVVVATDYPGLGTPGPHPYLVGESEGRAVLDSIRASRDLLGDRASATSVVFGHSQGGHASVFADALARSYAPELDVVGVAAMAPPTALPELVDDDQGELNGIILTALAIASWDRFYPDTHPGDVLHTVAEPVVDDLGRHCIATTAQGFTDLPDVGLLEVSFLSADPATAPGWAARLEQNSPKSVDRDIPLLVVQGLADDMVRPKVTESFVRAQCAAGANVELHVYPGVGHFQVRFDSAPSVREWLLARLDGSREPTGCSTLSE